MRPRKAEEQPDDRKLVLRARAGDTSAYGELVRRYQRSAIRVAAVAGGSQHADDAAQDAFVKAYLALDSFDTDRTFAPWLFQIVANTARNAARTQSRQQGLSLRVAARTPIPDITPEDHALGQESRESLLDAMRQLGADDQLILAYRWFEQLSEREIAEALNVPAGTVKSRLSRAMGRLASHLDQGVSDGE